MFLSFDKIRNILPFPPIASAILTNLFTNLSERILVSLGVFDYPIQFKSADPSPKLYCYYCCLIGIGAW